MAVSDRLFRPVDTAPDVAARGWEMLAAENEYLLELARHYRDRLLREENLSEMLELAPSALRVRIDNAISRMIRDEEQTLSAAERASLITFIINEAIGFGPLERLLIDPTITEIMVNGPDEVYIEQQGRLNLRGDVRFTDSQHIRHIIDRIVSPLGRRIDESSPMVDARLPDGSRINAVIPPLSLNGPVLTIRRFQKTPLKIENLLTMNTLTWDMADLLRACVEAKLNILVSGGTGSGKTNRG